MPTCDMEHTQVNNTTYESTIIRMNLLDLALFKALKVVFIQTIIH